MRWFRRAHRHKWTWHHYDETGGLAVYHCEKCDLLLKVPGYPL